MLNHNGCWVHSPTEVSNRERALASLPESGVPTIDQQLMKKADFQGPPLQVSFSLYMFVTFKDLRQAGKSLDVHY